MSGLFSGLFGSEKETSVQQLPEQMADIQRTNEFRSGTMMPAYKEYVAGAKTGYEGALPGMYRSAQNLGNYAGQVAQLGGEVGESAARTGVTGLQSFFDPRYGIEQYTAAMAPIQSQYQQNLAQNAAMYGGAGQLGSSRQALAEAGMAGQTQAAQMQAAANVMRDINAQRLAAGQALTGAGQNYLGMGLGARGTALGAAERPLDWYSTLGKQYGMVPQGLYTAPYPGQQSSSTTSTPSLFDTGMALISLFSDSRLKENIKPAGEMEGINVYTYNYKGDKTPRFGVMAQELKNTKYANAVSKHSSGYYVVDYGRLPESIRVKAFA